MELTKIQKEELIEILRNRFINNINRHEGIDWKDVEKALETNPNKLVSLSKMEASGGEPDVVKFIVESCEYIFFDCSIQSPIGRRSVCFDEMALKKRKTNKPWSSVEALLGDYKIELLTIDDYNYLQGFGDFDTKTSSWVKTPIEIRARGGALFCDRRYNTVFTYHNGADSYYSSRGFRGKLKV